MTNERFSDERMRLRSAQVDKKSVPTPPRAIKTRWRTMLRIGRLLSGTTLLALVAVRLALPQIGQWLSLPDRVGRADAIVVLGGSSERTLRGIELYQQGAAPAFWQTGNCATSPDCTLALQGGVPEYALQAPVTHSTWQDGAAIAELARKQNVRSILVVTDWYHARRALGVMQKQLAGSSVTIFYEFLPPQGFASKDWWRYPEGRDVVIGELIRIGYYWLRYGVKPAGSPS